MNGNPDNRIAWIRKWGGVFQTTVGSDVPIGMFYDLLNYEITDQGELAPRQGFGLLATAGTPDASPIRTVYRADFDGIIKILIATEAHVYEYVPGTDTWTTLYTITVPAKRMMFGMLNAAVGPLVIFGNGGDAIQKWSGTGAVAACADAPVGRPVIYKNFIAVFDIPSLPGKVHFCWENGNPDKWDDGLGNEKYFDIQGKVTALAPFGGLVIFTTTRTEYFSGDPDAPQGKIILSESIGCPCAETIAECSGALVWLSRAGIMTWDGGGVYPSANLSNPDNESASRIHLDISNADWSYADFSTAVYHPIERRYYLSMRLSGLRFTTPTWRTYVLDLYRAAWFPWSCALTGLAVYINSSSVHQLLAGTADGSLLQGNSGAFVDKSAVAGSDVTYSFSAQSGDIDFELPDNEKTIRSLTVATSGIAGAPGTPSDRSLTVNLFGDFNRVQTGSTSFAFTANQFILNFSRLGDRLYTAYRFYEIRKGFALRTKHLSFFISGSGAANAIKIAQMGWEWRPGTKRELLIT